MVHKRYAIRGVDTIATRMVDTYIMRELRDKGSYANQRDPQCLFTLFTAASSENMVMVQFLILEGLDANT